ncbi:MAG: hypothetical protein IKN96_08120 [Oscillibacter sp.]|nr:hypothetical protein [Oscillibacter sp.]
MSDTQNDWTLRCEEQWKGGRFFRTECRDDALCLKGDAFAGTVCLPPLDSGESAFRWTRLRLTADIPQDAGLRVYAAASDYHVWPEWADISGGGTDELRRVFGEPAGSGTDILLSRSGRYLWLALELTAGGEARPRVDALSVRMSGDHMADYLPAIYQGDDFTWRFLSIFNSIFQDMEAAIEDLPRQFSPSGASPEMLEYMAQWLCMDAGGGAAALRERLPAALEDYETMYTTEGVKRSAYRLTGKEPFLIEHFRVNPNAPDCRNPALYRKLYGEDPYRFFLLLPQGTFERRADMERFLQRMSDRIPAETSMELVILRPCVQLDWHTYLGVNSQIGDYIPASIDESMTLHYDKTIGGTDHG